MFSTSFSRGASAYQRTHIDTGVLGPDQHQMVVMLYEGVLHHLTLGKSAMQRKDIPVKCSELSKAMRILEEGLRTGLDTVDGGELARNLEDLYDYCLVRIALANARNDEAILDEVQGLLAPLLDAWREIRPEVTGKPAVQSAQGASRLQLVSA